MQPLLPAWAQGGGASSTGTIQGRVTDAQGAVLPGVTVTATSPALLGQQTTVSSETGNYRFPAVPPGTYTVTYELAGFNTLRREGISITLGFTANLNVELTLATLQETVTVTGASPVIDTTSTRVQQNFKLEQLQSIPNGRDMWALLAVTPAVQMTRIDVGGNRAGTQTGYNAYGFTGQVRVLIEGINTTEGTGGAGFYFDYASLEEAFLGTSRPGRRDAEPRRAEPVHRQVGRQPVQRRVLPRLVQQRAAGLEHSRRLHVRWRSDGIRERSNEIDRYYDTAIQAGGPIKKDKVWWFGTYRKQFNAVAQPQFRFDQTFDTELWNAVGKGTYQVNQKNKLIGYYQWGQKLQATRLPYAAYFYNDAGSTNKQDSGSWVYKARVERHGHRQAVRRSALRRLRLLLPADGQHRRAVLLARHRPQRADRRPAALAAGPRPQADHRGGHLLPRHRQGQPHLQGRRRDPARDRLGRLRAAVRRQHRSPVRQRRLEHGGVHAADGDRSRQARRWVATARSRRSRR